MQNQNQQANQLTENMKKMVCDIKKGIQGNFEDALEKMKAIERKIDSISTSLNGQAFLGFIKGGKADLKGLMKSIGVGNPDEIQKLIELAKEALDKASLSLYTLKSVKDQPQKLNSDLNNKKLDKEHMMSVLDKLRNNQWKSLNTKNSTEKDIFDSIFNKKFSVEQWIPTISNYIAGIDNDIKSLEKELNNANQACDTLKNEFNVTDVSDAVNNFAASNPNQPAQPNTGGVFSAFKLFTGKLMDQMNKFSADIEKILTEIPNNKGIQNKEDVRGFLAGLVFGYECEQFDNFAHNLQHFDKINSDAWNERSMFNMKCDENGKLERGGAGLNNIGATCYMNATLQSLRHMKSFNKAFKNLDTQQKSSSRTNNGTKNDMTHEMIEVVKNLDDEKQNPYSPNSFKKKLSVESPLFAGIQANDSKDLINFLIERWHQENNQPRKHPHNEYDNAPRDQYGNTNQMNEDQMRGMFQNEKYDQHNSFVSDATYGIMETKSKCFGCQVVKYNFQVYSFLEFPLQEVNKYCSNLGRRFLQNINGTNPDVDLDECFEYYGKIDLMSGDNQMYCNICGKLHDAHYQTVLEELPNDLIINLNRGKGAVYECNVNFQDYFDCHKSGVRVGKFRFKSLNSIICHLGPSSMSGHFIAFTRSIYNRQWYKYNDSIVTEVTGDVFNEIRKGMPYILFYQHMDGKEMLHHALAKAKEASLKLAIQDSFNKLSSSEMQERFAYLLMCAAESNLDKYKKSTLSSSEIANLIQLVYDMIKGRNDLLDDNRMEVYRNVIDTFISTKNNFFQSVIIPLMNNVTIWKNSSCQQEAAFYQGYVDGICEKFSRIVLKKPQDMYMFTNLLQCAASYNLSRYNWSSLVCAVYELIKSDEALSDTVGVKIWNDQNKQWEYYNPQQPGRTSRELYYKTIIDNMVRKIDNKKNVSVNDMLNWVKNNCVAPYNFTTNESQTSFDNFNRLQAVQDQQGHILVNPVFIASERMDAHIKLYSTDSHLLNSKDMLTSVLNIVIVTDQWYTQVIQSKFNELDTKPEEQKRFIYLLAYPIMNYSNIIDKTSLCCLISVIYEMIRAEKNLCDDSLIFRGFKNYTDNVCHQHPQVLSINRMTLYKDIIFKTTQAICNKQLLANADKIADYINTNFSVTSGKTQKISQNLSLPRLDKRMNINANFYCCIDYCIHHKGYKKAISDKYEELQSNPNKQRIFVDLIKYAASFVENKNMDSESVSSLICAVYEMIRDDYNLSDGTLSEVLDNNQQASYIGRAQCYKNIIHDVANSIISQKNIPIALIVKYMNSNFKIANNFTTTKEIQNQQQEYEVNQPMNIELHSLDSPMTAQEMIDDVVNRLSDDSRKTYANNIKNQFNSLKGNPKEQKIFAYLLQYTGINIGLNDTNLSLFTCATFDAIKDQFAPNKFKNKEYSIDIKANEKMADDVAKLVFIEQGDEKNQNQTVSITKMKDIFEQQKNNQIANAQNNNNIKGCVLHVNIADARQKITKKKIEKINQEQEIEKMDKFNKNKRIGSQKKAEIKTIQKENENNDRSKKNSFNGNNNYDKINDEKLDGNEGKEEIAQQLIEGKSQKINEKILKEIETAHCKNGEICYLLRSIIRLKEIFRFGSVL